MDEKDNFWDVVIVGVGIAGLSAGMYCGRFNLKTLIIGEMPGGTITTTHLVENYPGIISIEGAKMGEVFLQHAQKFGAQIKFERALDVSKSIPPPTETAMRSTFKVRTSSGVYVGKALVLATGTEHKKLGIPGEKEFYGKGVSYCALCDAAFFKGKTVGIVGGGDSSAIEALILAAVCKKVYMFVRKDILRAEPINYNKVMESKNIELRLKTEVAQIRGKEKAENVLLKSGEQIALDGVFMAIGHAPISLLARDVGVALDDRGQIKINRNSETNVPGVYAAGDVCDTAFKQAITGAAEAVTASYFAYQYLQKPGVEYYSD